jgi:glycerophosphoryl diester phosphodiesterase
LRTLRARERLPDIRPQNSGFDGLYQVPTLAEIIALVRAKEAETGRVIGIYPEIKHPTYFTGVGHDLAAMLVEQLHAAGYRGADAPVFIQSFDVAPLRRLEAMTDLRLVQLVAAEGGPADDLATSYAAMVTPEGLAEIAQYADAIGADFAMLFSQGSDPQDAMPTGVHSAAHGAGLLVHAWTARKENAFLPPALRSGDDPAAIGCDYLVYYLLRGFGIDGVFSDDPARAIRFGRDGQAGCPEELAAVVE